MHNRFDIPGALLDQIVVPGEDTGVNGEHAWMEVIRKMDDVYADVLRYQVELEEKNAALEEARDFIRSVLASMTDVLVVCDVRGNIQQVNQALEHLTGKSLDQLRGKQLSVLFAEDSMSMVERFPEHIRSAVPVADCEVSLVGADGKPTPLAMNCTSHFDPDGRLSGMVLVGRPVGELRKAYESLHQAHLDLKQAQQQLVQSEKMASLGRLVAGVAHELNNPISFVFGNMHALKRYGERLIEYLAHVHAGDSPEALARLRDKLKIDRILNDINSLIDGSLEGAERVGNIVQDLKRFSSGQREQPQTFKLAEVISTAAKWVSKVAPRKPELSFNLDESLQITAYQGHIHQILINLIQNAIDVMEDADSVRLELSCGRDGDHAWVTVRDHGPGIPDSDMLHIFDPFFTTKPVGKGTGLGLYISYGLATEQGGGSLTARNHPEGGAVFTLRVPLSISEQQHESSNL